MARSTSSSTLDRLRAKATSSQTVTAGDLIGGTPFLSGLFHDEPAVESLNAMGLDVSSVGNHEFDEGVTELKRMQRGGCHPEDGCYEPWGAGGYPGADFPWLAANVVRERTGRTVLPGTWVTKVKGVKVGYIGMTLKDTPTLVAQSGIQGVEFRDEVQTANRAARDLRRRGVETIIVLLHEGGLQTGTYRQCTGISGPIVNIAKKLSPSIDLVVTGHTHQPYICNIPDPAGKPRMVTSASSFGRVVTETTLTLDRRTGDVRRNKTTATNHLVTRTQTPDPVQTEIIAAGTPRRRRSPTRWSAPSPPTSRRSPNRDTESTMANVIADAQLAATSAACRRWCADRLDEPGWRARRPDVRPDLRRRATRPGDLRRGVRGAAVRQPAGDHGPHWRPAARPAGATSHQGRAGRPRVLILGVSQGFSFTYNPAGAFGDRIDPASISLNGTVIDPAATYRIVTNSFLADGGDAFTVFREGTNRAGGGDDLEALTDYLGTNSPVAPPGDRIAGI